VSTRSRMSWAFGGQTRPHPWHAIEGSIQTGDVLVALGAPDYLIALASAATGSIDAQSVALE